MSFSDVVEHVFIQPVGRIAVRHRAPFACKIGIIPVLD